MFLSAWFSAVPRDFDSEYEIAARPVVGIALLEREVQRVVVGVAGVLEHPDLLRVGLAEDAEGVDRVMAPVRVVSARSIGLRLRARNMSRFVMRT